MEESQVFKLLLSANLGEQYNRDTQDQNSSKKSEIIDCGEVDGKFYMIRRRRRKGHIELILKCGSLDSWTKLVVKRTRLKVEAIDSHSDLANEMFYLKIIRQIFIEAANRKLKRIEGCIFCLKKPDNEVLESALKKRGFTVNWHGSVMDFVLMAV